MTLRARLLMLGLGIAVALIAVWRLTGSNSHTPTATPATPPGPGLTIGINANSQGYRAKAGVLQDRVARTGVRWLREELDWDAVETRQGHDDWTRYDDLYTAAAQRGMHVLPLIISSPAWAEATPMTIPSDPAAYAAFVARVVARYGPGGDFWTRHPDLPAVPSRFFELWNEPWYEQFSTGGPDAARYARLVAAAGAAAHAANPAARVLIASDITAVRTAGGVESWTDAMYDAVPTLNQDFDAVAVHPYGGSLTDTTNDYRGRFRLTMENVRADFVAHGAAGKPFWLTEIGWSTCPAGPAAFCVTEPVQAALLTQLFALLRTTYASYARAVFLYHYNDQPRGAPNDREAYFGLTRADGSPKPAYEAFRAAIANRLGR